MRSAIKSFLVLTWLVLIIVFLGWSYARYRALSSPIKAPLDHAFLKDLRSFAVIAYPNTNMDGQAGVDFLKAAAPLSPDLILWIDIRPRIPEGTLVVARDEREAAKAPTLLETLESLPTDRRLILSVRGHQPNLIPALISIVEETKVFDRTLFQSPEDGFLSELRKERPLWLYGTSLAQITQLIMLSSVGLESLAPLRGDVVVLEEERALWRLNDRAINEVNRRGLRFFAGPVKTQEQALDLKRRGIGAVLISDPQLIQSLSSQ